MDTFKKLSAGLKSLRTLKVLACIFSSLYLTAYIDLYMLRSTWMCLPVFWVILAVFMLLSLSRRTDRLFGFILRPQTAQLSIVAAVLLLAGCRNIFPPKSEIYISLVAETSGEICLCDVVVDGENIPVGQAEVIENSGWLYREQWDNFMIWPEEDGIDNCLTMRFYGKEIHLGFPYTPYAGSVTIEPSFGDGDTWDLHCPERTEGEEVEYADLCFDSRVYSPLEVFLYGLGILSLITLLGPYLRKLTATLKKRFAERRRLLPCLIRWLAKLKPLLQILKKWLEECKLLLLILKKWVTKQKSLLSNLIKRLAECKPLLLALNKWIALYAFLLSCTFVAGEKMSMGGSPYFQPIVTEDLRKVALLFLVFFAASSILLKAINSKCLFEIQSEKISKKWWLCAWLLLTILWIPYLLAYYPGTLSPDSFTSLLQAKNLELLYNHIPIAYTLLIALFARIGWTVGDANFGIFLFTIVQTLIMGGVLSYTAYWVRNKVRHPIAAFAVLLFYGLNPIVALHSITMWKDVLYSAWIVLLCLFLFDMAMRRGEELGEKKRLAQLGVLFVLVSFGRNNGIYVILLCWIILLLAYKRVRKKLFVAGGGMILSILLIQGPGYKTLGIDQAAFAESVGIPLQQICYAVVTDGLPEGEEQEFLENIIPIKTIKENYSPISADSIKFNAKFNTAFFEQNKPGFIRLYFKLLPSHLRSYIQAYLLSTVGFWHIETISWVAEENICENDMGIYNPDYFMKYFHYDWKESVSKMITFLKNSPVANVGLMVWFVFLYMTACLSQKQSWKATLALPLVGCWLTLMIATPVNAQFRYVYYYHLMLPVVGIMFFIKRENT